MEMIQEFFTYIDHLFQVINHALRMDPLYEIVSTNRNSTWPVLGVVFSPAHRRCLARASLFSSIAVTCGRDSS